jgi:hypothetical protein
MLIGIIGMPFSLGVPADAQAVGLSVSSPRCAASFTLQSLTRKKTAQNGIFYRVNDSCVPAKLCLVD